MLLGVDTVFVKNAAAGDEDDAGRRARRSSPGEVTGSGPRFAFDYKGPDTAIAINRLLKDGAHVAFDGPSHVAATGVARGKIERRREGLRPDASRRSAAPNRDRRAPNPTSSTRSPSTRRASAMYQPWTGGNMDEGWTRWVLEQYEFNLTSIHNADIRAGKLRQKFDAIILADQDPREHRRRLRRAGRSGPNIAAASARPASTT